MQLKLNMKMGFIFLLAAISSIAIETRTIMVKSFLEWVGDAADD